jgi:hypothetical protein|tara:strand:+ start:129 stop:407 length:279 start_codon:yes stop_codon:yes gene_type:complete
MESGEFRMWNSEKDWVLLLSIVQGQMEAAILRSRLESEGIPVVLRYESVGSLYGITSNELGEVRVFVPQGFLDSARRLISLDRRPDSREEAA